MLRVAPTLAAAALLATMLAVVAPAGATILLKIAATKDNVVIGHNDRLKKPDVGTGGLARLITAKDARTL
jgi:hypothetical protein